jgi:membrane-bound lytic murein transglycosylase D
MKNVKFLVKLRRFIKSFAVSVFLLVLFTAVNAFKAESATGSDPKRTASDSTQTDKYGFTSLFSASNYDPSKPYVAQLNPKAVPFVQAYIKENGQDLEKMKVWGKPYFDMYDGILAQYKLPLELKYLSVIESKLKNTAVSWAGAVGPWQLMPATARTLGLRVTSKVDERRNFYKSTHAASKMLKSLHNQFDDWLLVIAAYNCGAGRVKSAIRKSNSSNFWDMQRFLPLETRNHVKKFIGTHYIFEGTGGLTTMTASEIDDYDLDMVNYEARHLPISPDENSNTTTLEINGKYNANIIAKHVGIDMKQFSKLNPNFEKTILNGHKYNLRLPIEKMIQFNNKKTYILNESVQVLLSASK